MRLLVLGASGFIGSAVATELKARGDQVVGVARRVPREDRRLNGWIAADIAAATTNPADWYEPLKNIDAVVNCAGTLQDSPHESTRGVHVDGIAALYAACRHTGVRRVVHISAVGVDRATPTQFSATKLAGDRILLDSDLDYVILRPSVVIGSAAYGASALMRGLASLPIRPTLPDSGPLQPIHLDDLVRIIISFTDAGAPTRCVLDVVGPQRMSFDETVAMIRRWLGWRPAMKFNVPAPLAAGIYRIGDIVSWLDWSTPIRTTARHEIARGAVGDAKPLRALGVTIPDIEAALFRRPASVQEHWFAALYVLKPIAFAVLVLFWIGTGIVSLSVGWTHGIDLMRQGGADELTARMTVIAGASADILIGAAIAYRPLARAGLWGGIALSLLYAVIGTVLIPALWTDPLGPMLKIWPIVMLHALALAILEAR